MSFVNWLFGLFLPLAKLEIGHCQLCNIIMEKLTSNGQLGALRCKSF